MTDYARLLLPNERTDHAYRLRSYAPELSANKARLVAAFEARRIVEGRRILMMAMAMIETTHLSPRQRDDSKDDFDDGSANASIFNLNEDMIRRLGGPQNIHSLDPLNALPQVVALINRAIDLADWGITPNAGVPASGVTAMLDFVRGGSTTYRDGTSYDAAGYRRAVATAMHVISNDMALMTDDRRVEMNVAHQTHR